MIRAALFDMGGVLVTSPFAAFSRYEQRAGLPEGTIRRLNATNPDTNAWARFERGEIDADEFAAAFDAEAAALGYRLDATEVLGALQSEPIELMIDALPRVRAVARTALLTNNMKPLDPTTPIARRVLPHLDVIVQSSVEGLRKPDVAFYELACQRLDVAPAECVFLDDLGVNLKPARALGMRTIKVVDAEAALSDLEAAIAVPLR